MEQDLATGLMSLYCERTQAGLWEEPLNAVTNLAFIVAGLTALGLYRRQTSFKPAAHWDFLLMIALLFSIGLGSGLWHVLPTGMTVWADVIPILLFMNVYLLSLFNRGFGVNWAGLLLVFAVFQVMTFGNLLAIPRDVLNGSLFYAPAWLTLVGVASYMHATKHPLRGGLTAAAGIFTASLVFRTVDRGICQGVPLGTHFVWHLLNAWLLYVLVSALISEEAKRHLLTT